MICTICGVNFIEMSNVRSHIHEEMTLASVSSRMHVTCKEVVAHG